MAQVTEEHAEVTIRLVRKDTTAHLVFDISRLILSSCLLIFSIISIIYAIQAQVTLVPSSWADQTFWLYLSLLLCLFLLGLYEGLQIAVVELAHQNPELYSKYYVRAAKLIKYENEGRNVERFLVGRQVIVVAVVFILARITTFDGFWANIPQSIITATMHTGFLGVILVVIVAQLTPQVLAAAYPTEFLDLPGMKYAFQIALLIETSGLAYAVWGLSWIIKHSCSRCLCPQKHHKNVKEHKKLHSVDPTTIDLHNPTIDDEQLAKQAEDQVVELAIDRGKQEKSHLSVISNSTKHGNGDSNDNNTDNGASEITGTDGDIASIGDVVYDDDENDNKNDEKEDDKTTTNGDDDDDDDDEDDDKTVMSGEKSIFYDELMKLGEKLHFPNVNKTDKIDATADLFYSFPIVIGDKEYPSPAECFGKFKQNGLFAPRFLLPSDHKDHIPPHIVAMQLLRMYAKVVGQNNLQ